MAKTTAPMSIKISPMESWEKGTCRTLFGKRKYAIAPDIGGIINLINFSIPPDGKFSSMRLMDKYFYFMLENEGNLHLDKKKGLAVG